MSSFFGFLFNGKAKEESRRKEQESRRFSTDINKIKAELYHDESYTLPRLDAERLAVKQEIEEYLKERDFSTSSLKGKAVYNSYLTTLQQKYLSLARKRTQVTSTCMRLQRAFDDLEADTQRQEDQIAAIHALAKQQNEKFSDDKVADLEEKMEEVDEISAGFKARKKALNRAQMGGPLDPDEHPDSDDEEDVLYKFLGVKVPLS